MSLKLKSRTLSRPKAPSRKKANRSGTDSAGFKRIWIRVAGILLFLLLAWGLYEGITQYKRLNGVNVFLSYKSKPVFLEIPTGCTWIELLDLIERNRIVRDLAAFQWAAQELNYSQSIRPGRYDLSGLRSNRELVELLKSGRQAPVGITIRKFRRAASLAAALGSKLEPDSADFHQLFLDTLTLSEMGLRPETAITLFIPGEYEFLWNTSAYELLDQMHKRYLDFWSQNRKEAAIKMGFSSSEVMTLASIVDEESDRPSEFRRIAGVYINRMRMGMPLQADPTLRFASGNDDLRRIEGAVLRIESPYNTYLYTGLPPGPVCTPSIEAIDSTLSAERHNFLYFCARSDFSGYHSFASDFSAHQRNARAYQRALNAMNR
ncbi:MAG: endolytic transglycosylase MltG [Sphingomonadales bacterium]|nr:endolytic transglycosylase MltG [Sphingomonadales bacterium]